MNTRLPLILTAFAVALAVVVGWLVLAPRDEPAATFAMPDVVGADVDAVGRQLSAAGYRVKVRRPEIAARNPANPTAGPYVMPESLREFEQDEWTHLIAAQSPPAGSTVRQGSEVLLTTGVHHGAGPFQPWLEAHGQAVRDRGSVRCPACHEDGFCSACHDALSVEVGGEQ